MIGQLFAAGEVAFTMALGKKLEGWTVKRAKKGFRNLGSVLVILNGALLYDCRFR